MDLEELRTVRATERQKDSLQHLRDTFYEEVADYLAGRRETRDDAAEAADRPYQDDRVRRLSDEIQTAEDVAEALYERRVGKVVKMASFAAADMPVEDDGLTDHERALFDDLVERIEHNKTAVLDGLAGDASLDLGGEATAETTGAGHERGPDADLAVGSDPAVEAGAGARENGGADGADPDDDLLANAMGGDAGGSADATGGTDVPDPTNPPEPEAGADRAQPAPSRPSTESVTRGGEGDEPSDRTTVRVTDDVGEILGVDDRAYDLATDDVVRLPTENAEPLLASDAAERLD